MLLVTIFKEPSQQTKKETIVENIEKEFALGENKQLTDKNGFKLACVSPMDNHKIHIIAHLRYFYHKSIVLHLIDHVKALFSKKEKHDALADYLLEKYTK
jgi:hypothetical protein